ncbi:hypothetical protein PIROE2DRAFT_7349 [Piromyces sp. E2]|nr:hypothetical protein PIROE2DRAFT_7349 [Piromyces sp. E2]|eukprot:OUM65596.1 hypothetical protein PIROE2DRAFT_7349 [Piromyces sp. E2]
MTFLEYTEQEIITNITTGVNNRTRNNQQKSKNTSYYLYNLKNMKTKNLSNALDITDDMTKIFDILTKKNHKIYQLHYNTQQKKKTFRNKVIREDNYYYIYEMKGHTIDKCEFNTKVLMKKIMYVSIKYNHYLKNDNIETYSDEEDENNYLKIKFDREMLKCKEKIQRNIFNKDKLNFRC